MGSRRISVNGVRYSIPVYQGTVSRFRARKSIVEKDNFSRTSDETDRILEVVLEKLRKSGFLVLVYDRIAKEFYPEDSDEGKIALEREKDDSKKIEEYLCYVRKCVERNVIPDQFPYW